MDKFDKDLFSQLLNVARGDRTINQYGMITGVDPGHISRLINKKVNNPPRPDTIKKLAKKAHNNISYEHLMSAAGYLDQDEDMEVESRQKIIISNLKLIMDGLEAHEFAEKLKNKTGFRKPNSRNIQNYLNENIEPTRAILQVIADYADVSLDFFYQRNDAESLKQAQLEYKNKHIIPIEDEYRSLIDKIKLNNLDIKSLHAILDMIIQQQEKK